MDQNTFKNMLNHQTHRLESAENNAKLMAAFNENGAEIVKLLNANHEFFNAAYDRDLTFSQFLSMVLVLNR